MLGWFNRLGMNTYVDRPQAATVSKTLNETSPQRAALHHLLAQLVLLRQRYYLEGLHARHAPTSSAFLVKQLAFENGVGAWSLDSANALVPAQHGEYCSKALSRSHQVTAPHSHRSACVAQACHNEQVRLPC